MAAIARSQASTCATPILDVYTSTNGVLVDVYALSFQIFDHSDGASTQIYPATLGDREVVDLTPCPLGSRLAEGHYVARWTCPVNANIGTHSVRWFVQLSSSLAEQSYAEEFEVLAEVMLSGTAEPDYTTVAEMRAEGVSTTMASDSFLLQRIALASRLVDAATGRFFAPRAADWRLDGRRCAGGRLELPAPILAISHLGDEADAWDPDEYVVYNRHLTGLLDPDDRDYPHVVLHGWDGRYVHGLGFSHGSQNIRVSGVFGYTDPDGTPFGTTPLLIKHVTKLLVLRNLAKLGNVSSRFDALVRARLTSERTRDQSYTISALGTANVPSGLGFTGDPEIDNILAMFRRPFGMAAV